MDSTPRSAFPPAPIQVSIVHADLACARYPLMLGHYVGDLIVSAEAALDRRLGGALSQRFQLGLYPGALETQALFRPLDARQRPPGALVMGLGQVGDLTPSRLRATAVKALLAHAQAQTNGQAADGPPCLLQFSSLLIGSGGAGLSLRDSVEALAGAAVEVNDQLQALPGGRSARIEALEFVELYEDLAIAAAHALADALRSTELHGRVEWSDPVVQTPSRGGGRHRRFFDTDRSWDKRIEILELDGRLQFTVAGQRARAELQLATGQVELADAFLREAVASTESTAEIPRTLFEMLLPLDFRLSAPDERGLVLLLDRQSARFPWELLEDRWSLTGRPLAIEASVVRQFKTDEYRAQPLAAVDPNVLIIGDPDLGGWEAFEPLEGAQREARAVEALFTQSWPGYHVSALVGKGVADIQRALHQRPWRILHLAGHGEHAWKPTAQSEPASGMVIGHGVFLTPGDVQQLRHVPELVFVNCCHSGRTERAAGAYHRLAANLGEAFIAMGVRAVVAAGWAVDDDAASTFAQTFYAELLDGQTFRDAVRRARTETHDRHPSVNTWGAFQCYGEPGWRLNPNGRVQASAGAQPYHAPQELLVDLGNVLAAQRASRRDALHEARPSRPATGPDATSAAEPAAGPVKAPAPAFARASAPDPALDRWLATLLEQVPPAHRDDWLARADVASALGRVLAGAGQWPRAGVHLARALQAADAGSAADLLGLAAVAQVEAAIAEPAAARRLAAVTLLAQQLDSACASPGPSAAPGRLLSLWIAARAWADAEQGLRDPSSPWRQQAAARLEAGARRRHAPGPGTAPLEAADLAVARLLLAAGFDPVAQRQAIAAIGLETARAAGRSAEHPATAEALLEFSHHLDRLLDLFRGPQRASGLEAPSA